ncbi:MAG: hypothetical protein EOO28_16365 [Comamonadaceae bacterium]|nr:MAG: hypothetical protein EOO28_16365 [Comamonadaceae bacterium]
MSTINSANRTSLLASLGNVTFGDGGDIAAVLDAVKAGVVNQLSDNVRSSSEAANLKRQQLAGLLYLQRALPDLQALAGGTVALGLDAASGNALAAEVTRAKLDLETGQTFYIAVNGGEKHIASPAELTQAQSANLSSAATAPAVETRTKTDGEGHVTTYTLFKDEKVLTASKADVDKLYESVSDSIPALLIDMQVEDVRLQASMRSVQANVYADAKAQAQPLDLRKTQHRRDEGALVERREDISEGIRRQHVRDRDDTRAERKTGN